MREQGNPNLKVRGGPLAKVGICPSGLRCCGAGGFARSGATMMRGMALVGMRGRFKVKKIKMPRLAPLFRGGGVARIPRLGVCSQESVRRGSALGGDNTLAYTKGGEASFPRRGRPQGHKPDIPRATSWQQARSQLARRRGVCVASAGLLTETSAATAGESCGCRTRKAGGV